MKFINQNLISLFTIIILFAVSIFLFQKSPPATVSYHFVDLASAFLHGQVNLEAPVRDVPGDTAFYNNKYYVYFGLLPSVLVMPLVALFGKTFPQATLLLFFVPATFFVLYKICRNFKINENSALWLAISFMFGSIYMFLAVNPITAYQVQIIGLFFVCLAIFEFSGKRRYALIGLCIGLAGLTRPTYYFSAVFFLAYVLLDGKDFNKKSIHISLFSLALLVCLFINGLYNYARFGSFLETGYNYQTNTNIIYTKARESGTFSLAHVPGNLYFLLFRGPDAVRADSLTYVLKPPYLHVNEWGLGIFFTSPIFLYAFLTKLKEKYVISALVTILFVSIPMLTYFGIGVWQYGYRYGLDFYPFLFLMLLSVFKEVLPLRAKVLIAYSILFNFFYMFSVWNLYPLFQ